MKYFPLFIDLSQQNCLVIGGGQVALRKVSLLLKAKARIHLVALEIEPELVELLHQSGGRYINSCYASDDLQDMNVVIAATNDKSVNQQISADAKQRELWINVVDNPDLSNFIFPALVDRSPLTVAISSDGAAPVLARLTRAKIEAMLPSQYGELAQLAKQFRQSVKQHFKSIDQRRHFWESVFQGPIAELVLNGKTEQAIDQFEKQLKSTDQSQSIGEVYLVGAGPGDPDLLTFRALRLMQQADVVLYDRLVSAEILELVRRDAKRINVGKLPKSHPVPQNEINHLLIQHALAGKRVLRLKGGDPFIFGRGGEEIEQLLEHHIPFQVVPGITAASGCAAYAGIPLTHRDYAQSVRFVTGHMKGDECDLPWENLASASETLVIYMGVASLAVISKKLQEYGMKRDMPVAVIESGTTASQRVIIGDLTTIDGLAKEHAIQAPSLLIIGEVVTLHDKLAWFKPNEMNGVSSILK